MNFSPCSILHLLDIPDEKFFPRMRFRKDLRGLQGFILAANTLVQWMVLPGRKDEFISPSLLIEPMQVLNKIVPTNLQSSKRPHQISLERIDTLYKVAIGL